MHRLPTCTGWTAPPTLAVCLAVGLSIGAAIPATGQTEWPALDGFVVNDTGINVSAARINNEFRERLADPYGLHGLFIFRADCGSDPEGFLDAALVHYGHADAAGYMFNDSVAWLVCQAPRHAGFYWAAESVLSPYYDPDAVGAAMGAQLRDGNYTGAATVGIETVVRQIERGRVPGLPTAPSGVSLSPEQRNGSVPIPVLWGVPVAGGAIGYYLWRRRRTHRPDVETGTGLTAMRNRAARLAPSLTAENTHFARLILATEQVGDEAILELHRHHQAMADRLAAVAAMLDSAEAGLRGADPEAATPDLERAAGELATLEEYASGLVSAAERAERLTERAAIMVEESRAAIAELASEYANSTEGLDLPEPDLAMALAALLLSRAESALATGDRLTAGGLAEDAAAVAREVASAAARHKAGHGRLAEGALVFQRLARHAESSWADVAGNGSEAEESLDAAATMLRRLAAAAPEALGRDPAAAAMAGLGAVNRELSRAEVLLDGIRDRLGHIERAREAVREFLPQVESEAGDAEAWLKERDVDADVDAGPTEQVAIARRELDAIASAQGAPAATVDWPDLLRRVEAASRTIDLALGSAREQQARIASLRNLAHAAREAAGGALAKAERYAEAHARDVGATGGEYLAAARASAARAEALMRTADAAVDAERLSRLDEAARSWEEARQGADAAYSAMENAVRAAEKERGLELRRRDWAGSIVPTPRHSRGADWRSAPSLPSRPTVWGGAGRSTGGSGSGRSSSGSSSTGSRSSGSSSSGGGSRPSSGRRGGGTGW